MSGKRKLEHFAEMKTFPHVVEAPTNEILNKQHSLYGKWHSQFFGNDKPITLELGCGKGEYTLGLAEQYPQNNHLGIDIKGARIWRGAKTSHEKGMKNVGFIRTKVDFLSSFFAPKEVEQIWLTFSDPQVKKALKRMTSSRFLGYYKKVLSHDGLIHVKTDSQLLYQYTCAVVEANELELVHNVGDIYNNEIVKQIPELNIKTHYEAKWLEDGYPINYICFRLGSKQQFVEPVFDFDGEIR